MSILCLMSKEHHIVYVPGLSDQSFINRNLSSRLPVIWGLYGFKTHIIYPHWQEGNSFHPKLSRILQKIDELNSLGYRVSLVGQSAGAGAVLNAFCERREMINGVINICGRVRTGAGVRPTLEIAGKNSLAFVESVLFFERKNEPSLNDQDRKKIMTVRSLWDEVVPKSTVPIIGAKNIVIPFVEHSLSGIVACTLYSAVILGFLKKLA